MTKRTPDSQTAILYVRVSTVRQASEGLSLEDQIARLEAQAVALGYSNVHVIADEGRSGGSLKRRPGLAQAREMLAAGEASALIATKLDRVSRNAKDVLTLADEAERQGWRLIVLDVNLDTATPVGRLVLTILAAVAEMERKRIAERQADSHAHRRSIGQVWGVTHGPRSSLSESVRLRIIAERSEGQTLAAIADGLTADGIATAKGGERWYPSTVRHVLASPASAVAG